MNYGIKVSQDGFDVGTCSDFNLVFSSKYDILKIGTVGTGSFTTGGTATIAHNFGYTPSYLLYLSDDNVNFTLYHSTGIGGVSSIGTDNLKITKGLGSTDNYYYVSGGNNYYDESGGGATGFRVGHSSVDLNGALRMTGITETGSVTKAELGIYLQNRLGGNVNVKTWGIDEDNTADFSSNPMGRTQTSGSVNNVCDAGIGVGNTWSYEVTGIVNEILGRAGWSSGNSMGFLMFNGTTIGTNLIVASDSDPYSYLKLTNYASPSTIYYKYVIFRNKLGTNTFA